MDRNFIRDAAPGTDLNFSGFWLTATWLFADLSLSELDGPGQGTQSPENAWIVCALLVKID